MGELTAHPVARGARRNSMPSGRLSIGEAADATGLSISTLRYYEKEKLLTVPRNASGQRRYDKMQLDTVRFIDQLRRTGMPIRTIRAYAELVREGDGTAELRMTLLKEHRTAVAAILAEQQQHLAAISYKIDAYRAQLDSASRRQLDDSPNAPVELVP